MSKSMSKLDCIADHYIKHLVTDENYFNKDSVKSTDLLYPDFNILLDLSVKQFNEIHPDQIVIAVETYRSNSRQLIHYNNGASKIKKDGMHHFGIAIDYAFNIDGKFTYDGNYESLREKCKDNGLFLLGDWDKGHIQFIPVEDQQELRAAVHAAVIKFQKENSLVSDGIIGPKTIAKAKEVYING